MEARFEKAGTVAKATAGIVVAAALTLGLGMAMAADLQRSFAVAPARAEAHPTRRGVVIVESGVGFVPAPRRAAATRAETVPASKPSAPLAGDPAASPREGASL